MQTIVITSTNEGIDEVIAALRESVNYRQIKEKIDVRYTKIGAPNRIAIDPPTPVHPSETGQHDASRYGGETK